MPCERAVARLGHQLLLELEMGQGVVRQPLNHLLHPGAVAGGLRVDQRINETWYLDIINKAKCHGHTVSQQINEALYPGHNVCQRINKA